MAMCLAACDCGPNYEKGRQGSAPQPFSRELLENKYPIGSKIKIYSSADALIGGAYLDPRQIFEVEILEYSYDLIKIKYIDFVPGSWNEKISGDTSWRQRRHFFPVDLVRK
jgi:hypothetical protein